MDFKVHVASVSHCQAIYIFKVVSFGPLFFLCNQEGHSCVAGVRYFNSPRIFLCKCNSGFSSFAVDDSIDWATFGIAQLFVVIVGFFVDLADVNELEEFKELLPKHKENSIIRS